jgi:hypothetical protein
MLPTLSHVETSAHPTLRRPATTVVSLAAAKAGRECVWVLIAAAFCVVEVLVFLTDLPATKRSVRRETTKSARQVP